MPLHRIDVNVKDTVVGSVNGKRNLLTGNFWVLFFGLLLNSDAGPAYDDANASYTLRTSGDVNYNCYTGYTQSVWLRVGTGTPTQPTLRDFSISTGGKEYFNVAVTFGSGTDRNRVTVQTTADVNVTEVGLTFKGINISGGNNSFLIGRVVQSIPANKTVAYYVDFLSPWTYNTALMMYGVFQNADVSGIKDVSGTTRSLRSSGDLNAGPVRVVVSSSQITWSPTITSIPNMVEINTIQRVFYRGDYFVYMIIVGEVVPSSDMTVNTIGLVQRLYDSSGNTYDAVMLAMPLSNPITLPAYRENLIMLRFVVV